MQPLTFIDLFAGCGGLSLGLMRAGWQGILAVEKSDMAFTTLEHNLLAEGAKFKYRWPEWFPKKHCGIKKFLAWYGKELHALKGQVTMIAGGPPCQGFSLAGRRRRSDHRNELYKAYMEVVRIVQPQLVLLENVQGIRCEFGKKRRELKKIKRGRPPVAYSTKIISGLEALGYRVFAEQVRAVDYGVPQLRPRFFVVGIRQAPALAKELASPFDLLTNLRTEFLAAKGLPHDRPVSVQEAISDLERSEERMVDSPDTKRFKHGLYGSPVNQYQVLMREGVSPARVPDSHRFANHLDETVRHFARILATCRRGVQLNDADRKKLGIKKTCIVPLDPDKPSHTLTTLPDDIIHYDDPRILTVREYARIQSFPDWFEFKRKYTTGDKLRRRQCPRYSQVGNAVPPLLAEAIGTALNACVKFPPPPQRAKSQPVVQELVPAG